MRNRKEKEKEKEKNQYVSARNFTKLTESCSIFKLLTHLLSRQLQNQVSSTKQAQNPQSKLNMGFITYRTALISLAMAMPWG